MSGDIAVFAVVVTYLPRVQPLSDLLRLLAPQVARIIVVDNTPQDDCTVESCFSVLNLPRVDLIRLGKNFGIAKGLNVGIEVAVAAGATHVLLSDQDSEPALDMVEGLLRAEGELKGQDIKVGAVGPSFVNSNSGELFPFHVVIKGRVFHGRRSASAALPHVKALSLISSGCLVSSEAIGDIGLMREDFFIDSVDTEWCYRARDLGYSLYGTGWAKMRHRMGDSGLKIWYFGWVKANAYSSSRVYYQVRNLVRLQYLGYRGIRWKVKSLVSVIAIFYCHAGFGDARWDALKMGIRGAMDGIRGRMGELKK